MNIVARASLISPVLTARSAGATHLSARSSSRPLPLIAGVNLRFQLRNASRVATALESCRQPNPHNGQRSLFRDHAFPDREHVCVVMLSREPGGLFVPAQRATHSAHLVRRNS